LVEIRVVDDDGPGIPPEILPVLFTKFVTKTEVNERGTGLALFITKAIVEAHNSRINAENNRASGSKRTTTFTVSSPLHEQQPHQLQGNKRLSLIQSRLKTF
jgi:signal transduction histidine kinase